MAKIGWCEKRCNTGVLLYVADAIGRPLGFMFSSAVKSRLRLVSKQLFAFTRRVPEQYPCKTEGSVSTTRQTFVTQDRLQL